MKKLVIALVLVFVLVSCSTMPAIRSEPAKSEIGEYSYLGIIDPNEIYLWTNVANVRIHPVLVEGYFSNPDPEAKVLHGTVIVKYPDNLIIAYSYIYNCKIYVFLHSRSTNCFERLELNEKQATKWYEDYRTYFGLDCAS